MSTQADAGAPTHLGRHTVLLLAVVCGAAVANIYYAQPLLPVVARAFSVGEGEAGLLVTASQIGYAVALAFLVPLGDVLERRRLVSVLLAVTESVGLDPSRAAAILGSDEYADEVRERERMYLDAGIHSVPAVIINNRHLISGGQPAHVFAQALRQIAAGE